MQLGVSMILKKCFSSFGHMAHLSLLNFNYNLNGSFTHLEWVCLQPTIIFLQVFNFRSKTITFQNFYFISIATLLSGEPINPVITTNSKITCLRNKEKYLDILLNSFGKVRSILSSDSTAPITLRD